MGLAVREIFEFSNGHAFCLHVEQTEIPCGSYSRKFVPHTISPRNHLLDRMLDREVNGVVVLPGAILGWRNYLHESARAKNKSNLGDTNFVCTTFFHERNVSWEVAHFLYGGVEDENPSRLNLESTSHCARI